MVITNVNQVVYQGDGSNTAFPFTFQITDYSEIRLQLVYADGTVTDITSDFYVDTVTNTVYYPGYAPGAEPALADQPPKVATGQQLVVYRDVPMTQEVNLGTSWPFSEIEYGLDKLTMICQQIYSYTNRKLDAALNEMFQLAGIVTDSGELQHITDQYNAIDSNAAIASAKATAAANSATAAANSATAANTSATNAATSYANANTVATALTDIYNDAIDQGTIVAPAVDATLSVPGAAADAKVTGDRISVLSGETNLDSIAFGTKTYRDIFVTNNFLPKGDFESGLDWITTNTNNAVITDEASVSKRHSLKCFGTSSTQIRKDITSTANVEVVAICKVRVDRYASGGGAGFVIGGNHLINHTTNNLWETIYYRTTLPANVATSFFTGTVSAADCDAYIDDVCLIDLTTLFGSYVNFPTETEMKTLYNYWITIKNMDRLYNYPDQIEENLNAQIAGLQNQIDEINNGKPILVGAVLDATSGANRFAAMRELYTVAEKMLTDPSYVTSDSDLTYADKGAVCVLPQPACMYQKYPIDVLYAKNGTTTSIPASTTKIMTLVTGLDYLTDMHERVTIINDDIQDGASSILLSGDIVTITDLMYAMLLNSSNTAAQAFARVAGEKILISQNGSGTYTATQCQNAFIAEMAVKAGHLGMVNSSFVMASGRSESNYTTAEDMLRFTIEACSYPEIQKIWNKKTYTIRVKGANTRDVSITTTVTDVALETLFYVFGGKTGTLSLINTSIALVMVAQKK